MRRLSDEQQECQSTPLLDLAAARLVKMGVDLNTKCVTIFLTQSKISYKPRIMHKFCRFDKKIPQIHSHTNFFTKLEAFSKNSRFCQDELFRSAENCSKRACFKKVFFHAWPGGYTHVPAKTTGTP